MAYGKGNLGGRTKYVEITYNQQVNSDSPITKTITGVSFKPRQIFIFVSVATARDSFGEDYPVTPAILCYGDFKTSTTIVKGNWDEGTWEEYTNMTITNYSLTDDGAIFTLNTDYLSSGSKWDEKLISVLLIG